MTAAPQTPPAAGPPVPSVGGLLVFGLDLSLTCTGVASVGRPEIFFPATTSSVRSKPDKNATYAQRGQRLRAICDQLVDLVAGATLVVVEGPSYASQGAGTWDRAGLWWQVVSACQGRGQAVAVVSPDERSCYGTGKYKASKDQVMAAVIRRYLDVEIDNNNESDALVLAAMGARRLGHPIDELPLTHLRAMDKVAWPVTR